MNITLHRAINTTPYEAVFGITAHREKHQNMKILSVMMRILSVKRKPLS